MTGHCGEVSPHQNERRDSKAQLSEKEKWRYACRLFGRYSLKEGAMWPVDPLLGNYRETSKYITAIAK
jgi:hypothetical protein